MLTAMGKWKELSLAKKALVGVAGLFIIGAFGSSAQKSQTPNPATNQNVDQASSVNVSRQQPIDTKEVKTETKTEVIPYTSSTQNDAGLAAGTTSTAVAGVNGERTITYSVTYTNGKETARAESSNVITTQPVNEVKKVGTKKPQPAVSSNCDSNYSGCVPIASDVDCAGGSGNGPAYVSGPINVIGSDIYKLDSDHDGIACE